MAYALSIYHKTNKKSRKDAARWKMCVVTTPMDGRRMISSMHKIDR